MVSPAYPSIFPMIPRSSVQFLIPYIPSPPSLSLAESPYPSSHSSLQLPDILSSSSPIRSNPNTASGTESHSHPQQPRPQQHRLPLTDDQPGRCLVGRCVGAGRVCMECGLGGCRDGCSGGCRDGCWCSWECVAQSEPQSEPAADNHRGAGFVGCAGRRCFGWACC
jgi:hypothetical protein